MTKDVIERVVERVLHREFRTRLELGKALGGVSSGYITRLSRRAVELGLVDSEQWMESFKTGKKSGQRGPNKQPRKERLGPTATRVLQALESSASN